MTNEIKKDVNNRLATINGHINGIKNMIEEDKGCEDILLQLFAVESSINKLGKLILKNHLNTCVKESIKKGESDILERFNSILERYL